MPKLAFLGTGLLGSGMAEAAAKRGNAVVVWNRTLDKARALEQFGAVVAPTPAEAVIGADHIHLILKDDTVVDEIIDALRPGLTPNAVIVDHTTNRPDLTAARSARLNGEGVRYLHCPVFMGPAAARVNQGIVMASGPQAIYDEIKGELGRMCARVEYIGERPDMAAIYKLCGNAYIIGIAALVADVFAVAGGGGVAPNDALEMMEFFNPATIIAGRGKSMASGNYTASFELTMARKDLRLMMETAGATEMIALPAIAERMDTLIAEGHGADDLGVIGKDAATSYTRRS